MEQHEMIALVERHLKAEGAADVEGAVAVYTDDIEHDAVGFPGSPRTGKQAASEFYGFLTANFRTEEETPRHRYFSGDSMILEQTMTGTVIGEMLELPATAAGSPSGSSTSSTSATAWSAGSRCGSTVAPSWPSSPADYQASCSMMIAALVFVCMPPAMVCSDTADVDV
jgi:hypothetical protein